MAHTCTRADAANHAILGPLAFAVPQGGASSPDTDELRAGAVGVPKCSQKRTPHKVLSSQVDRHGKMEEQSRKARFERAKGIQPMKMHKEDTPRHCTATEVYK